MGLLLPNNPEAEREMRTDGNRMMVFRSAEAWERLDKYRKK